MRRRATWHNWARRIGADAPFYPLRQARLDGAPVHLRPDADIVDYVVSLGGTSRELIEHDEIRAMLLKLDKADFCLIEADFVSIQTIRYWRQA
ncbi:hypothetical protein [Burkholderia ubonensis]|uniref:hypothetical protein n=1 Tax=Burkholderia ubonensis TaxID=101571 RepID=UPI000A5DE3E7|nr:hypothetical protein [Burkholderia ubonensis]